PRHERADGELGDLLPSPAAEGCRSAGTHRQHAVEQQHPLVAPGGEVAVRSRRDAEIALSLPVDVAETAWQRTDIAVHCEGESDRMPGRRIGVLSGDED